MCLQAPDPDRERLSMATTIDRPVPFSGSEQERLANYGTHIFCPEERRCWNCDCRPGGDAASYPCGGEVPREVITVTADEAEQFIGGLGSRLLGAAA
jgi:hypothetical protein